jgi:TfoX/Sxy family transcriptional regulator of competence genes
MKSTYRILFYIRKTRPNKDGLVTIAIRITIDGESLSLTQNCLSILKYGIPSDERKEEQKKQKKPMMLWTKSEWI